VLQLLELGRSVQVRLIARQSALERIVGREDLDRSNGALNSRPLDALDLSEQNWEENKKRKKKQLKGKLETEIKSET